MTTDNHHEPNKDSSPEKEDVAIREYDLKHSISSQIMRGALWTDKAVFEFNKLLEEDIVPQDMLIRAVTENSEEGAALAYDVAEWLASSGFELYTSVRKCLYYRAAELGCLDAYAKAAEEYYRLQGIAGNDPAVLNWAKKGAAQGDAESLNILAMFSEDPGFSAEVPGDTFDLYLQAAEKGSVRAMFTLYEIYSGEYSDSEEYGKEYKGKMPLIDKSEAKVWLTKALDAGYDAMDEEEQVLVLEELTEDIEKEQAEDRDPRIADLRKRARTKETAAQAKLGSWYAGNAVKYENDDRSEWYAEYWLKQAVENGDAEAQYELAMYYTGLGDKLQMLDKLEKEAESSRLLQRSAAQGFTYAEYELGKRYVEDPGSKKVTAGVELLKKAADKEFAPAVYELGWCYRNGKGVKSDAGKAAELFRKALKDKEGLAGSVPIDQAEALLADTEKQIKESRKVIKAGFFERHQGQLMGIGAAVGLILFEMAYQALGAGLFGEPTVNIHGFLRILLLAGSAAGIFACTVLALMSVAVYIGMEGFMTYPALLAGLFILFMKKYPIVNRISLIVCGVIIAIHVLVMLTDR